MDAVVGSVNGGEDETRNDGYDQLRATMARLWMPRIVPAPPALRSCGDWIDSTSSVLSVSVCGSGEHSTNEARNLALAPLSPALDGEASMYLNAPDERRSSSRRKVRCDSASVPP